MSTIDFVRAKGTLDFDAIWYSNPFGNFVQAVTTTGHTVLRALFPVDAEGSYVAPRLADADEEDAWWESVLTMLENAGLFLRPWN